MRNPSIPFSTLMIRALLDGRKTQTRRLLKPQPQPGQSAAMYSTAHVDWQVRGKFGAVISNERLRFRAGDRVWVREATHRAPDLWVYSADGVEVDWPGRRDLAGGKRDRRPAMFLPRTASRLTLIVTDVRVQRLQEISEEDAVAEGAYVAKASGRVADSYAAMAISGDWFRNARHWYRNLWGLINGPDSWCENPWVAAYTFSVHKANIDALEVPR